MLIETIKMIKGEDAIIVNASERDKYVEAGYENEKAAEPAKEPVKESTTPIVDATKIAEAAKATAEAAKAAGK